MCSVRIRGYLKIEAAVFSETLVPIYQNALRHTPEESNLITDHRENPKSHIELCD
jgi:hypothetical protein